MALRSFSANHSAGVSASATLHSWAAERETGVTDDVIERARCQCHRERKRETGVGDDITEEMWQWRCHRKRWCHSKRMVSVMSQEERQVMSDSKTDRLLECQTGRDREQLQCHRRRNRWQWWCQTERQTGVFLTHVLLNLVVESWTNNSLY